MKKYKVRFNCSSFHDVVIRANSEDEAIDIARNIVQCPQNGMEFGEMLKVEKNDEVDN